MSLLHYPRDRHFCFSCCGIYTNRLTTEVTQVSCRRCHSTAGFFRAFQGLHQYLRRKRKVKRDYIQTHLYQTCFFYGTPRNKTNGKGFILMLNVFDENGVFVADHLWIPLKKLEWREQYTRVRFRATCCWYPHRGMIKYQLKPV